MKEDGSQVFWEGSGRPRDLPEARVWRTKEGRDIPYSQLDSGHLLNILMWLRRRSLEKAQDVAHRDGVRLGPDGWRARKAPDFDGLLEEARRRRGRVMEVAELIASGKEIDEAAVKVVARKLRSS
jgi:hypothetical protein